jgi:hypothetical protein
LQAAKNAEAAGGRHSATEMNLSIRLRAFEKFQKICSHPVPVQNQMYRGQGKERSAAPDMNRIERPGGNDITKNHRK